MLIQAALRESTPDFDKLYYWRVPPGWEKDIHPGQRVVVPFGRSDRPVEAVVFKLVADDEDGVPGADLHIKALISYLESYPILNADQLRLAGEMRLRYACTYGDAIKCMIPPSAILDPKQAGQTVGLLKERGEAVLSERIARGMKPTTEKTAYLLDREAAARALEDGEIRYIQQVRVLEFLLEYGESPLPDIMDSCAVSRSSLNTLKKNGWLAFGQREVVPEGPAVLKREGVRGKTEAGASACGGSALGKAGDDQARGEGSDGKGPAGADQSAKLQPDEELAAPADVIPEPTPEQAYAIRTIHRATVSELWTETGAPDAPPMRVREFLLDGITGSGKTEVYMQVASQVLDAGRGVIILVPEISLTPQMVDRLVRRFGDVVAVLHSRLTPRERFDQWLRVRRGDARLVIGARSAIFAPVADPALIVVDEEQETTYQSEIKPRYNAISVARLRVRDHRAALVLGSATPSIESYHRTTIGRSIRLVLSERPGEATLPITHIIDMRQELIAGNRGIFSRALTDAMTAAFSRGEQAMLLLNRRGYSGSFVCRDCGESVYCKNCDVRMTYHRDPKNGKERLQCHYCGRVENAPRRCPSCHGTNISGLGLGTQQAEEAFHRAFPGMRALRMDQDTTIARNAHHKILQSFRDRQAEVLIGTQMIAKGHDFPNVTVVGILSADQLLGQNDFRAGERAFQLMTQAAGRAGRGTDPGRVFIQAYDIDHYAVTCAAKQDYQAFYRQEIAFRRSMRYSPFGVMGQIAVSAATDEVARRSLERLAEVARQMCTTYKELASVEVLRPSPAFIRRINKKARWQLTIKADQVYPVSMIFAKLATVRLDREVALSLKIDPG